MKDGYVTIATRAESEFEEKRSLFIGHACPCKTEEEAVAFISEIKSRYPDATHNVYAYYLRADNATRYSDDREPQGTAGLPVLDVIRKGGIVDAAVVVTRYFGGTLLGTGGLVRAYTRAAAEAINAAGRLVYETLVDITVRCDYSMYQKILPIITCPEINIKNTEFSDTVFVELSLRSGDSDALIGKITDALGGRGDVNRGEEYFGCMSGR